MIETVQVVETERPPAPVQTQSFRLTRPSIVGPDIPVHPYPIKLSGPVQRGFGRGSKDLGCPTANLPDDALPAMSNVVKPGVYYGFAKISPVEGQESELPVGDSGVLPMVMSLGWNPFYKNERMTAEIHIMHEFQSDFYGHNMKALVLGYIRPELDYTSREALIDDIETDKRVSLNSLQRPDYQTFASDPFFTD
ncbi:riboflavin kinase [Leucogyrophana mollusca]|uniref:Riboflavin kinase n=1 Tax=Leucogyrophana mollusca TaxID=85980 RepID=A0ACB8C0Y3_9AGAM|nr:riboflavin kinase [Leucogyrophana mollusca]